MCDSFEDYIDKVKKAPFSNDLYDSMLKNEISFEQAAKRVREKEERIKNEYHSGRWTSEMPNIQEIPRISLEELDNEFRAFMVKNNIVPKYMFPISKDAIIRDLVPAKEIVFSCQIAQFCFSYPTPEEREKFYSDRLTGYLSAICGTKHKHVLSFQVNKQSNMYTFSVILEVIK